MTILLVSGKWYSVLCFIGVHSWGDVINKILNDGTPIYGYRECKRCRRQEYYDGEKWKELPF